MASRIAEDQFRREGASFISSYVNSPSIWAEAKAGCRANGAELASIHSDRENECIYKSIADCPASKAKCALCSPQRGERVLFGVDESPKLEKTSWFYLVKNEDKRPQSKYHTIWLGGRRRKGMQSSFEWIDSTPFNYTNWAKDEPGKRTKDQDCMSFYNRRINGWDESSYLKHWNVISCHQMLWYGYVCKKPFVTPAKAKARRKILRRRRRRNRKGKH
ncbi:lectin C-type domain protein [Teladorsagia circumcincta]|uniref:Lectin C-type domain protein n=1 Tax=Teladorsagia circumcincta TaxID=45464 RepID=A0A2G9UAY7_TELCI|nr:lectin C-type domain protein [Teladorsagia circumcincta]